MKNTVLLIEPRPNEFCNIVLNQYIKILGTEKWNYIFYFGKGTSELWKNMNKAVELRELEISNFDNSNQYNDFMKQKSLWENLPGEYILTIQLDTWIMENTGYSIDYFIALDKTFIGGNMRGSWGELIRDRLISNYNNFNGGLSLRKRLHMIEICERFPPEPTTYPSHRIETDAEDVYFTIGCYKCGFPLGNDEITTYFAVHRIYNPQFFGIHQASAEIKNQLLRDYPSLSEHPYIFRE